VNLELDVFQEVIAVFRQHSRDLEIQFPGIGHLQQRISMNQSCVNTGETELSCRRGGRGTGNTDGAEKDGEKWTTWGDWRERTKGSGRATGTARSAC
jgi:hypothetical protein